MFRHPKYYKNLRKLARNRELQKIVDGIAASATDQAISDSPESRVRDSVRPGPGPKHQASSAKLLKKQATSVKPQAASIKLEATSVKLHDT